MGSNLKRRQEQKITHKKASEAKCSDTLQTDCPPAGLRFAPSSNQILQAQS